MRSRQAPTAFAAGDFSHKLSVPRTAEFASVAESLNAMADDLDEKIRTVTRERNEREAVLVSMIEGVLAVDTDERVITLNEAAARLLGTERSAAVGHSIQEVVRNPELQRVVAETLAGNGPVEAELTLRVGLADRTLQANASLLRGEDDDGAVGAVVVLNDVTRLKRLEAVRRDFVANVSPRAQDAGHVHQGLHRDAAGRRRRGPRGRPSLPRASSPARPIA